MPDATPPLPDARDALEIRLLKAQVRATELASAPKSGFTLTGVASLITAVLSLATALSAYWSERQAWQENAQVKEELTVVEKDLSEKKEELRQEQAYVKEEVDLRQLAQAQVLDLQRQQIELLNEMERIPQLTPELKAKVQSHRVELPPSITEREKALWQQHEREAIELRDRGLIIPDSALQRRLNETSGLPTYRENLRERLEQSSRRPGGGR